MSRAVQQYQLDARTKKANGFRASEGEKACGDCGQYYTLVRNGT